MRMTSLVAAGLVLAAAGCSREKKAEDQPAATPGQQAAPAPAAPAAPAAGATHDVNMVFEGGTTYKYVPAELTIKVGDVVRFHNKSGGPHNVSFWADSIPSGAQAPLDAAMPDKLQPLSGNLIIEQDAVYQIPFAGVPAGEYKYYCLPHLAMAMKGKITVQ